jgi:DNA-binding NarL/FixJ family response regulator
MEVISLLCEGLYYKEIAAELNVSMNTIETYRKRIFKKWGVQNRVELFSILGNK